MVVKYSYVPSSTIVFRATIGNSFSVPATELMVTIGTVLTALSAVNVLLACRK
jgi:hypothetical protein